MEPTPLISVDASVEFPPIDALLMWTADEWPKIVGNGSSTVRIYRIENRGDDRLDVEFRLVYRVEDRKVCSESFADFERAERRAVAVFVKLASADIKGLDVSKTWHSVSFPVRITGIDDWSSDLVGGRDSAPDCHTWNITGLRFSGH